MKKHYFLAAVILASITNFIFISSSVRSQDGKLQNVNKIVIFRLECKDGSVSFKATSSIYTHFKAIETIEFKTWYEDNSPSYNYKRTPPEKRSKICKNLNANAMLIGNVQPKIKYGKQTFKGRSREGLSNVRIKLRLIDTDTGKVLWQETQDSSEFIQNESLTIENYDRHIRAAAKHLAGKFRNLIQK